MFFLEFVGVLFGVWTQVPLCFDILYFGLIFKCPLAQRTFSFLSFPYCIGFWDGQAVLVYPSLFWWGFAKNSCPSGAWISIKARVWCSRVLGRESYMMLKFVYWQLRSTKEKGFIFYSTNQGYLHAIGDSHLLPFGWWQP